MGFLPDWMPAYPQILELRLPRKALAGNVAEIVWSDGSKTAHTAFNLRMRCPCAGCSHDQLGPRGVPPMVEIANFDWVGNYAVNFIFNDGHNTGIYTYKFLREIDESAHGV